MSKDDRKSASESKTTAANADSGPTDIGTHTLDNYLGTFEGFNFRDQCAIEGNRTAEEVIDWDHDKQGEAEFWPSGDVEGVQLVCRRGTVTGAELLALGRLFEDLGGTEEGFLLIHFAVNILGYNLCDVTRSTIDEHYPHIFSGTCFTEIREAAAYELFELYYPDTFRAWEENKCDGLIFDVDRFLDSPSFKVDEVLLGGEAWLLISPQ